MNSIPSDGTGERIERWRVYESAVQLDAIQFWYRFDGRWLRGAERRLVLNLRSSLPILVKHQ
jgi:hypothetical protein